MTANVRMYSSSWCPYCIRAKQLLERKNIAFEEINVDGQPQLRSKMMQESGQRTVPQIWINEVHVGGCDDLFALERANRLDELLGQ